MYQVSVNQKQSQEVVIKNGELQLDGKAVHFDIIESEAGKRFHLLMNNKSFDAELVKHDPESKTFFLKINGRTYEAAVKDKYDQLLHSLGLDKLMNHKVNDIKAPMPGLVLSVKVKAGDTIKKGDALLILEAMKMENIIKSPGDGVVKAIAVSEKQAVDKNQVLIELE